jgi:hypothetical protein
VPDCLLRGKHLPLVNSARNIPEFPDIPDAAPNDRECRERRECSGHTGENGRDFQPLALRTRAASGMPGMFLLPQAGARLYRLRITASFDDLKLRKVGRTSITIVVDAPMSEIDAIKEATANRVRRHRERRRRGLRCLTIEIRDREIVALVRHGLLDGEKRDDTTAIRAALHKYLDDTLGLC